MAQRLVVVTGGSGHRREGGLGEILAAELARRRGGEPGAGVEVVEVAGLAATGGSARIAADEGDQAPVVVYVPCRRSPDATEAAAVARAAATGARLVVVASTEIYEPSHRQPGLAAETEIGPRPPQHPAARRWWDLERAVEEGLVRAEPAAGGGARADLRLLRAAPVPVPGGGDWASRLLSGRSSRVLPGFDPPIQFLALPDLAEAVARAAVAEGQSGDPAVYNVVPAQPVPLAWALRLAGVGRRPWPCRTSVGGPDGGPEEARRWTRRRQAAGGWPYLAHPWTASGARAAADLGFTAAFTGAQVAAAMGAGGAWRADPAWWRQGPPARVDRSFDEHGMSPRYIAAFSRTLFRFLHDAWWRVEQRGVGRVPRQGAAVLVGVHRGFMPWDGVMALHLIRREVGRLPRFLVHPSLLKFPFLANYMRRLGGIFATQGNADLVLHREGLLAIFPEGIRGAFRRYRGVYELGNFGRRDYVRLALAHGAPIVPFVTVGSAEIYPILGRVDWRWVKRLTEWPYLPLTPTFPWLPVPLPSKWHTRFLEPLETAGRWSPQQADDPAVVAEIGDLVEERMQEAINRMLERRRSWWWGSVFDEEEASSGGGPSAHP